MQETTVSATPSLIEGALIGATTPAPLILGCLIVCAAFVLVWNAAAARRSSDPARVGLNAADAEPLVLTDEMRVADDLETPRRAA